MSTVHPRAGHRNGDAVALLPAVDRAAFAVALAERLRSHGVAIGLTPMRDLAQALAMGTPATRTALYWTTRICLVRDHGQLAAFDAVFDAVFGDAVLPADPAARRTAPDAAPNGRQEHTPVPGTPRAERAGEGLPWVTLPPVVAEAEHSEDHTLTVPERLPSHLAGLADTPFEQLTPEQTALLGRWLEAALRAWPTRRSRRLAVRPGGTRIAIRPTVARSRTTGFEPTRLVRAGPVPRPRRLVLLCDVSQSMRAQSAAYLYLMRAVAVAGNRRDARPSGRAGHPGALRDAECFAFAVTLTRLTRVLAGRSADAAIEAASERVADRFGGTRIAHCLRSLLDSPRGGLLRGAIVLIGSDGWDTDPPEELAAAMARLRRRAHRVIWLNPRASAPGFLPRTSTMAAALPYCDALLPAGTFASLARVPAEVADCAAGRGIAPAGRPVSSTASRGSPDGTGRP